MRIAMLTATFAPDEAPTSMIATRLAEQFASHGHDVWVGSSGAWYRPSAELAIPTDPRIHVERAAIGRRQLSTYFRLHTRALRWTGHLRSADVILSMSPPLTLGTLSAAIGVGRITVHDLQDVFPEVVVRTRPTKLRALIPPLKLLERATYAATTHLVTVADAQRAFLIERGVPAERITTVPNFADVEMLRPRPIDRAFRRTLGIDEDAFVALYAGNWGLVNDDDVLARAIDALAGSPLTFLLAGAGRHWPVAQRLAARHPNVKLAGYRPAHEVPQLYAAADVGLVTLRRELAVCSLPSKTYSIMASGRPFVAAVDDGSDLATLSVASGGGIAVAAGDAEAFAAAIMSLANDRGRASDMGRAARGYVELHHTPEVAARGLEAVFEDLIRVR